MAYIHRTKMTNVEEQELLELTRQNNVLLRMIIQLVQKDEGNDFVHNIIANLLANKMDGAYAAGYK